jgi:GNAT superfamily N-acetyltransferase
VTAASIRRAGGDDATGIAALSGELGYPATASDVAERLALLLSDEAQCVRVACNDSGSVTGWIHAAEQMVLESGRRCEILGLVVADAVRGAGIGRHLLDEVERWAAARGLSVVSLRCNVVRTDAHRFYARAGYGAAKTQTAFRKLLGSGPHGPAA